MSDAPAAGEIGAGTPIGFLPRAIRVARQPMRAVAVAWLTTFPVTVILAGLGAFLFPNSAQPQFHGAPALLLFALVVFAPVTETLIMGIVLLVLLRIVSPAAAILISAAGWGIAHSLAAPTWGIAIWWPFLIFSTLFVAWRERSLALAFALPMCAHALQNLLPALLIAGGAPL